MLQFDTTSWHYKLVLYVFGDSLFTTTEFDLDATIKKIEFDHHPMLEKDPSANNLVYKKTPKIINLCPYCRAVVAAFVLSPAAFVIKRLPKREKKPFDIKKSRRHTKIVRIIACLVFAVWGSVHLITGNYLMAVFQYSVASFHIWGLPLLSCITKWQMKRMRNKKPKLEKPKPKKNPSLIKTYMEANHDKICPPIAFVDPNDTEVRV